MIYHHRQTFEDLIFRLFGKFILRRRLKTFGEGGFVSPFTDIVGIGNISIGSRVYIGHDTRLLAIDSYAGTPYKPDLFIGDGTYIGHWCVLSCINRLRIGADVTLGDNVYIADSSHAFSNLNESAIRQPLITGSITIGDRAWLGKNSVVTHNVTIGNNAVVGANSFVNRDVAPYTIVAGNPAIPIKRYDFATSAWVKA